MSRLFASHLAQTGLSGKTQEQEGTVHAIMSTELEAAGLSVMNCKWAGLHPAGPPIPGETSDWVSGLVRVLGRLRLSWCLTKAFLDCLAAFDHRQFCSVQEANQRFRSVRLLKLTDCFAFDLPDAFSSDLENLTDFFESVGVAVS